MCTICQSLRPYADDCDYSGLGGPERAVVVEGTDAVTSTATTYTIGTGDTFQGTLGVVGDADWVRISMVAGQAYQIALSGAGTTPVGDPYLRLYDSTGTEIRFDDDSGPGFNSLITFTATTTGTFFIEAGSYEGRYSGGYTIAVTTPAPPRTFTMAEIALQLTNGYWGGTSREYNIAAGGTLNVSISALTPEGQQLALWAFEAWTTQTGIQFNTTPGAGATIHITFDDTESGAFASSTLNNGFITSSRVNVSTDWLVNSGTGFNTYSLQTYIHEIGHALGLGHAGNYNGSATYGTDNHYLNDSWQATIMSYFDQNDNTFVDASFAYVVTPMIADILAIQSLYGIPATLRSGNTIYGDNSTAGGTYDRISAMRAAGTLGDEVAWTIFDQGGFDTLDVRSSSANQQIDMRAGTASNIYGAVGNLVIALGTVLEQVLTGVGNDNIMGNDANNFIYGGQGLDTIAGGLGNDQLYGDDGNDLIYLGLGNDFVGGGAGADTIYGGAGANRIFGGIGADSVYGGTGGDEIYGGGTERNQLYGNDSADYIVAGSGGDLVAGGSGNDTLYGGTGNDQIYLGLGNDFAGGGAGNDLLVGGAGANQMFGGIGNDTLQGGIGRDVMSGGPGGIDVFVFASAAAAGIGAGRDVITDFTLGVDDIDLRGLGLSFTAGGFAGGGARQVRSIAGFVIGDVNGDGVADFAIEFSNGVTLQAGDFLL